MDDVNIDGAEGRASILEGTTDTSGSVVTVVIVVVVVATVAVDMSEEERAEEREQDAEICLHQH